MIQYLTHIILASFLVLFFELYRYSSGEPLSTFILIGYANTIGMAVLFTNLGKIAGLEARFTAQDNITTHALLEINKELGKLDNRITNLENDRLYKQT